jgi:archaellum biogenesis protein FlaJ (TadC family)
MKKYSNLLIITLFILSIIGLFLVSTVKTDKYFKSMGYIVLGLCVLGVTFLKKKQLKENDENI